LVFLIDATAIRMGVVSRTWNAVFNTVLRFIRGKRVDVCEIVSSVHRRFTIGLPELMEMLPS